MNSADPAASQTGTGRSLVPVFDPVAAGRSWTFAGFGRRHGVVAAGAAVAMGLSFIAGTALLAGHPRPVQVAQAAPPPVDPTAEALSRVQGEVRSLKASLEGLRSSAENTRQDETIRGLKRSIDTLKVDLEGMRTASTAAVGQIGAKLDKLDRDPGAKLTEMTARLDRIEKQVAAADVTGSVPPQQGPAAAVKTPMPPQRDAQAMPAAQPPVTVPPVRHEVVAKAEPARIETPKAEPVKEAAHQEAAARPATVEGWMLRDVYGGVALLEGRSGGLREVMPGEYIPGVGEVRSIERRGRGWVVVTSHGVIQADNRW